MTSTVCFVGSAELPSMTDDDRLVVPHLESAGIGVDYRAWDDPGVDWAGYDAVVVRSPWDYFRRFPEFSAWIDAREEDATNLWNPASVCRWNADKRYLEELRTAGIPVVETAWLEPGDVAGLAPLLRERGWDRAVVKPGVSGGAYRTFEVRADAPHPPGLAEAFEAEAMVQPLLREIEDEGEWSLVFFDRRFSHAALKRPASGDFRVQTKHGGTLAAAEPDVATLAGAAAVLEKVNADLLYARVDGVRRDGMFVLMELEILEPALFFEADPAAPARFVEALVRRLRPPAGATRSSSPGTA